MQLNLHSYAIAKVIDAADNKSAIMLAVVARKAEPDYSAKAFARETRLARYAFQNGLTDDAILTPKQEAEALTVPRYGVGFDHNTINNYANGALLIAGCRLTITPDTAAAAMPLVSGGKTLTDKARAEFIGAVEPIADDAARLASFISRADVKRAELNDSTRLAREAAAANKVKADAAKAAAAKAAEEAAKAPAAERVAALVADMAAKAKALIGDDAAAAAAYASALGTIAAAAKADAAAYVANKAKAATPAAVAKAAKAA